GKIEIFGLKRFRENLCNLARDLQDQVINSIFYSNNIKEVIKLIRTSIAKLKRGEYKVEDLAIWGVVDSFSNPKPPQVVAAEKANKSGYLVAKGDKIGYVIIKGSSNVSNRAEPFFMVKEKNKIDVEYYLNNQIIPSLMIVLKYFGIKEKDLKMLGADILDLF
ncbi:DNA polymerase II, partial [Sulfolobus sp. E3]